MSKRPFWKTRDFYLATFILGVFPVGALAYYFAPLLSLALLYRPTNMVLYEWNQKLTVTVATPEGDVSGSGIVYFWFETAEPCPYSGMSQLCSRGGRLGEATVVSLPNGRHLFALSLENASKIARLSFGELVEDRLGRKRVEGTELYTEIKKIDVAVPVPPDAYPYPLMVYFEDEADPTSVKAVEPNEFAAAFGEGYVLKSIALQITDEPIVYGAVEVVLPWIEEYKNKLLDGRKIHTQEALNQLANRLGKGSFVVGNNLAPKT